MKQYLSLIILLILSLYCSAQDRKSFSDNDRVVNEKNVVVVKPRRGFPEPMLYIETELSIVSLHLPTFINLPQPLSEMPRVSELAPDLPQTILGDEVYNITGWFPLDEMRYEDNVVEKRWVYYNKTSGYIISYADQFLQSSVYIYVKEKLRSEGITQRVSCVYISVDEKVSLNIKSLSKSSHEILWNSSAIVRSGEISLLKWQDSELDITMNTSENSLSASIDLCLYQEGKLQFNSSMHVPVNQWVVYEIGFSEAGKRGVMMIKVENLDLLGEVVNLPPDYELFIEDSDDMGGDPFGIDPISEEDRKRIISYRVPPDIIHLLDEDCGDPFAYMDTYSSDENGLKNSRERINISHLVAKQGVKIDTYFFADISYIIAYGTKSKHEKLDELLTSLGPYERVSYNVQTHFYEVDPVAAALKQIWIEDLLARNPLRVGSVGAVARSGERVIVYGDNSEFKIEPMRGENRECVDVSLDVKLNQSCIELDEKFDLAMVTDVAQVHYLGRSKSTGRDLVMLVRVSEIEWEKEQQK